MANSFDPTYGNYVFDPRDNTFKDPITGEIYDLTGNFIGNGLPDITGGDIPSSAVTIVGPDQGGGFHQNIWATPAGQTGSTGGLTLPDPKKTLGGSSTSILGSLLGTDDMMKYYFLIQMMNSGNSDSMLLMYLLMFQSETLGGSLGGSQGGGSITPGGGSGAFPGLQKGDINDFLTSLFPIFGK